MRVISGGAEQQQALGKGRPAKIDTDVRQAFLLPPLLAEIVEGDWLIVALKHGSADIGTLDVSTPLTMS